MYCLRHVPIERPQRKSVVCPKSGAELRYVAVFPLPFTPHIHNRRRAAIVYLRMEILNCPPIHSLERKAVFHPAADAFRHQSTNSLDTDARKPGPGFLSRLDAFGHDDKVAIQSENRACPRGELSSKPDVDRSWHRG